MSNLLMHYTIPNATIGASTQAIHAFRCGDCAEDFHLDKKPQHCPFCGVRFAREVPFGKVGALNGMIGTCLRCGHRQTLCGLPFTADIKCGKCLYINEFRDSQQPVSGRG